MTNYNFGGIMKKTFFRAATTIKLTRARTVNDYSINSHSVETLVYFSYFLLGFDNMYVYIRNKFRKKCTFWCNLIHKDAN